jgi:hypothetical protein
MHTDAIRTLPFAERDPAAMSHLVVVRDVDLAADRICDALDGDDLDWLGPVLDEPDASDTPAGTRRHLTDLGVQIGERATGLFRKAAFVDLGAVRRVGAGYEVEIGWQAATLAPLFPVFAGRLAIADGEVRIEGWYAPPGGLAGRVADRVLLNLAARVPPRWLLAALVDATRCAEAKTA